MMTKRLILLMLMLSGCCEFCGDDAPTYLMDGDFKDYTLFPVGSYWVYAEELFNEYDSVFLFQQEVSLNDSYYDFLDLSDWCDFAGETKKMYSVCGSRGQI